MSRLPGFTARRMRRVITIPCFVCLVFFFIFTPIHLRAAELTAATSKAWDQYLQWANAKVQRELSDPKVFLIQNVLPANVKDSTNKRINAGDIFVQRMAGIVPPGAKFSVPNGEIHHWWGTLLLHNVSLPKLLQFLQNYDAHAGKFVDVERSRLISKDDNHFRFNFRLRRSKAFVTAYYNTDQECDYTIYGTNRAASRSTATRIAQLENPGTPSEREKPIGNDDGYLWRLVSWWRFEQRGSDVVVELESASLSRDIPGFIKFLPYISQYIRSTPKETLESVLTSIRIFMAQPEVSRTQ